MDNNPQGRTETHWRRSMLAEKTKVGTSWEKVLQPEESEVEIHGFCLVEEDEEETYWTAWN